jgi:small subunit ribosomal protein S21
MAKNKHQADGTTLRGSTVEVRNGDMNRAMRRLKKIVTTENILREVREREFYEKPSLKRKKAKAAARKRWLKQQRENNNF